MNTAMDGFHPKVRIAIPKNDSADEFFYNIVLPDMILLILGLSLSFALVLSVF